MTPEQDAHWEMFNLVEEIRQRALVDLLRVVATLREITKVLEDNEAIELLLPETTRQNEFYRRMKYAKISVWKAMKQMEKPPYRKRKK